jgi:hypothetical protein
MAGGDFFHAVLRKYAHIINYNGQKMSEDFSFLRCETV